MSLFLLIHILILGGQSMIIKKSHFKLNNPTLEENLLPYQKKTFFLFTVMLFLVSSGVLNAALSFFIRNILLCHRKSFDSVYFNEIRENSHVSPSPYVGACLCS